MSDETDSRPVIYGLPRDPFDPIWQTHRMGGCVMDLSIPDVRANAIESGLIWSGPGRAIEAALDDLWTGRVPWPDPATITEEWREPIENMREASARQRSSRDD